MFVAQFTGIEFFPTSALEKKLRFSVPLPTSIYPTSKNQDDDQSKKCQDEKTSCAENFFLDTMNRSNCWEFIIPIKQTQDMNTGNFHRWNLNISSLLSWRV